MKIFTTFFLIFVIVEISFAQAPVIDGVFDGEAVWGPPASVADGIGGWPSDGSFDPVNIDKVYVTYDNDYLYFGAMFYDTGLPQSFFKAAFIINTRTGGAPQGPWGGGITFAHSDLPDFVLIARLGPQGDDSHWAESLEYVDGGYDGYGINVSGTDMEWGDDLTFVEARISKAKIGDPNISSIDFQFYVSNSDLDGVFDACPDDEVTTGWDVGTTLSNYEANYTVPVELTSFNATVSERNVVLTWTTATETNNKGFEIQRSVISGQRSDWKEIGFVEGNGTTSKEHTYSFIHNNVSSGNYIYRLKQIDFDGTFSYSKTIEVKVGNTPDKFALLQNYPNPFNPTTLIKYSIPVSDENFSSPTNVVLKVYDVLGNEIATLVNGKKEAGNYEIVFNAKELPTGIYIYTLQAGKLIQTKKMLLLK